MNLFNKLSGPASKPASANGPQLTLAAFGKHPGWDDHIPGIGVETECLAYVEKALYDGGIRGQIDAGAWAPGKLPAEKRLEGFDHIFFWLRAGHALLGQLWSSTDGKGRLNYPMVLCIDGQGVSPSFILGTLRPGLDKLREACLAATTADKVISDCRMAQEQLRSMLGEPVARAAASPPPLEARRAFLERPELGPSRQGMLRVLHELASIPGFAMNLPRVGTTPVLAMKSRHLRLPLGADSRSQGLLLWSAFLRCVLPDTLPLLFLARRNVPWLDLIIGEAAPDDFFCFQASAEALPLVTEIPYDIAPALQTILPQLEAKFVGQESVSPGVALAAAAKVAPMPAPAPAQASTQPPAAAPPAAPAPEPAVAEPARGRKRWFFLGCIAFVIIAVALATGWHFLGGPAPPKSAEPAAVATAPSSSKPNQTPQPNQNDVDFKAALSKARDSLTRLDYSNALVQADAALALKPGDDSATQLRSEIKRDLDLATRATLQNQKYEAAMKEAHTAFDQQDFAKAISQANAALAIRSNDPAGAKLVADAQHQIDLAAQAAQQKAQDEKFNSALKAGLAALTRKDYDEAMKQAQAASNIQNRPEADKLLADAKAAKADLAATVAGVSNAASTASVPAPVPAPQPAATVAVVPVTAAALASSTLASASTGATRFTNTLGMAFAWLSAVGGSGAWVGTTEVSGKQFHELMDKPDIAPGQDDFPVADISLADAKEFCDRLSRRENKKYTLPSTNDWLTAAGLTAAQASTAWSILAAARAFTNEVTSLGLETRLSQPARVGSRGPQANGLCDLFGNVREWTSEGQSAGFSYNASVGQTKLLFLSATDDQPWIKRVTGLRCVMQGSP